MAPLSRAGRTRGFAQILSSPTLAHLCSSMVEEGLGPRSPPATRPSWRDSSTINPVRPALPALLDDCSAVAAVDSLVSKSTSSSRGTREHPAEVTVGRTGTARLITEAWKFLGFLGRVRPALLDDCQLPAATDEPTLTWHWTDFVSGPPGAQRVMFPTAGLGIQSKF